MEATARWHIGVLWFVATYLIAEVSASTQQIPILPTKSQPASFNWSDISPRRQVEYVECYGGFQCARLDVPLNWNVSDDSREIERAAIALIRLPAKVPTTDPRYGGIIVVNPGGPGESGVDEVLSRGHSIQTIVDAPSTPSPDTKCASGKYFDIVGFDPRGVKYTTPSLSCFPDAFAQQIWLLTRPQYSHMFASDASFALEWARMEALGRSCSAEDDKSNMIRYANTAQTVEDMIAIIDRHGEWRQSQLYQAIANPNGIDIVSTEPVARTALRPEREMLQYWGSSWGSLLGQTFATIHPDRIGRLVIDGIVDPDDYYHNAWIKSLQDSDQVMSKLCEYCYQAGPGQCPLNTGSSAKDIETLVEGLIMDLKNNPIIAGGIDSSLAETVVIDFDDYYLRAINAMAFPFSAAEEFFQLLAELHKGNVTEVAINKQAQIDVAASLAKCRNELDGCMPENFFGLLGTDPAVECLDSIPFRTENLTKEQFKDYFTTLSRQSKWFSPSWARHRMACIGMNIEPAWSFDGKIGASTSSPLLIIGNTLDTVTPLENAHRVSTLFPGSVVLQQDSEGHCSHANPSLCTARTLRLYFQTGGLPEPGTVCEPDWRPFIGDSTRPNTFMTDADLALSEASAELAQNRHL